MGKIVVTTVTCTCPACPSQWEGTTADGQYIYARYRSGRMRVDVAPSAADWMTERSVTVYTEKFGHPLDGYITYAELKEHTAGIIVWPETEE